MIKKKNLIILASSNKITTTPLSNSAHIFVEKKKYNKRKAKERKSSFL